GRYRPVIPGTIIALVTGASGKNQKTKVNVSRESGIYLSRYLIWCVYDYLSISMGILVKALPHLRCVAAFTNILIEIMIRYAQK
uniref:hypothetical protein n=1 Tax=Waltera intestinalis TaxID=2606635 RepID=UPI003FF00E94